MSPRASNIFGELSVLLRGDPQTLSAWIETWSPRRILFCGAVITLGAGLYGAAMGFWRAPLQGLFVAIKFPLIMFLTTIGNALINAMLAPLLGLNISFRHSLMALLMSLTIASAILGSFGPLIAFLVWNVPSLSAGAKISGATYGVIQLTHVAVIALAGIAGNLRLLQLLRHLSGKPLIAYRVLFAWLGGNLFLGSQLTWILRPFIGSPNLPVQFLRETAFQGNFYETVFRSLARLFNSD
jgi:hypothetical protein